jgi:hypothetical protein
VIFDFLGAYRPLRNLPFPEAIDRASEHYFSSDFVRLGEFTSMFSKEVLVLQLVHTNNSQIGVDYFFQQIASLVPSQLVPEKLQMESTGDILSRIILGPAAANAGAGTAGAAIGDGYRVAGPWGVLLIGGLFGGILGLAERWIIGSSRSGSKKSVFRLAIFAGLCGWTFLIIRSDLGDLLKTLLYNCVLPLLLAALVLPLMLNQNRWASPTFRVSQRSSLFKNHRSKVTSRRESIPTTGKS